MSRASPIGTRATSPVPWNIHSEANSDLVAECSMEVDPTSEQIRMTSLRQTLLSSA